MIDKHQHKTNMFGSGPRLALIILLSVDDDTQRRMSVHVAAPEGGQSCNIVRGPGCQTGLWRDGPPKSGNEAPRCRCKARRGLPCFRQTFVAAQWDFASCIPVPGNDMCDAECRLQTTTCMHACAWKLYVRCEVQTVGNMYACLCLPMICGMRSADCRAHVCMPMPVIDMCDAKWRL